jgi:single-strand DNA-binding protein
MFGQRAEKVAKYITKGTPVTVYGQFDLRTYTTKNGPGASITCDVADIALQGGKGSGESQAAVPFDDKKAADAVFDDVIPF